MKDDFDDKSTINKMNLNQQINWLIVFLSSRFFILFMILSLMNFFMLIKHKHEQNYSA
jgi:hypothetical protein